MREKLRPEVRALLEAIDAAGAPRPESLSPEEAREAAIADLKEVAGEPEEVARVEDLQIPGPGGTIRLRVYTPDRRSIPQAWGMLRLSQKCGAGTRARAGLLAPPTD